MQLHGWCKVAEGVEWAQEIARIWAEAGSWGKHTMRFHADSYRERS